MVIQYLLNQSECLSPLFCWKSTLTNTKIKIHCLLFKVCLPNSSQCPGDRNIPESFKKHVMTEVQKLLQKKGNIVYQSKNRRCHARLLNENDQEPRACSNPVLYEVDEYEDEVRGKETNYCLYHTAMYNWTSRQYDKSDRNSKSVYWPRCDKSDVKTIILRVFFILVFYFQKCNQGHADHVSQKLFTPLLKKKFLGKPQLIDETYKNLNLHPLDIEDKGKACCVQLVKLLRLYITGSYMFSSSMKSLETLFTHFYKDESDQSDSEILKYIIDTLFSPTAHVKAQGHKNKKKVKPWVLDITGTVD